MSFLAWWCQSRFGIKWCRDQRFEDRLPRLVEAWKFLARGLTLEDKYRLQHAFYNESRMRNLPMLCSGDYGRNYGFFWAVNQIADVEGEIVECGVGHGLSLASLTYATSYFALDKTVFGFDSFGGFPKATGEDMGSRIKNTADAAPGWTTTSPELVQSVFAADQLSDSSILKKHPVQVKLIKGYFEGSLIPENLPSQIALLHADADMYASTKTILERCLPRMSRNGMIIFDEYHDERWPGCRKAADEICRENGLTIEFFDHVGRYGVRIP